MKNLEEKNTGRKVTTEVVEFVNFLREIRELTNENAHTEARLKIADYFGFVKTVEIFTKIQEIQDLEGHLQGYLGMYRDDKTDEMLDVIALEYGANVRDIISEIGL